MKTKYLVGVIAALMSSAALAQSNVTLWGRMDLGVQHVNVGGGQSRVGIDNGPYGTSRFGIRGVEDLGGGLSAIFAVESAIQADVGGGGGGGKLFNRGSVVGLRSTSWGSVEIGRQYVPIFWPFLWADDASRWRLSPYSAVQSVQRGSFARVNAAASPVTTAGSLDSISGGIHTISISSAYEDNLLVYKSPNMSGISFSLAAGAGAERDSNDPSKNDGKVFGGNFEVRKDWGYLGVGFNQKQGTKVGGQTQKISETLISGMFNVTKDFKVWGNVHPWKFDSVADIKGRDAMLGVSYWMPSSMLWANFSTKSVDNCASCDTKGFGVGYHYFLSKRTEIYAQYGRVSNQANAAAGLNGFNPSAPGRSVTAISVGIGHQF